MRFVRENEGDVGRYSLCHDRIPASTPGFDFHLRSSLNEDYGCTKKFRGLAPKLIHQRLNVLQVGGVEAFGEPVVDVGEHRAGFIALALLRE